MQSAPPPPLLLPPLRPRWAPVERVDPSLTAGLARELNLPEAVCGLLIRRGCADAASARSFLRPTKDQVLPPEGLAGMSDAVERVVRAIDAGETILVHGDYDVDGMCATAILVRALTLMGGRPRPFVPNRMTDGYDLGEAGIRAARDAGARLIVTVDCGIVAHEAVDGARAAGIDIIVTDHHAPGTRLPDAVAVLNPNRADCPYPGKGLAGAGVAFKLACAVARGTGFPEERLAHLLDLVAVATIADLAPLAGENRALVRWGLSVLARTTNRGLSALIRSTGLADAHGITAGQVGYVLAPRLNAAGRLGDAMRGVRLLLTEDEGEAAAIAGSLEVENRRRRDLDEEILGEALRHLESTFDPSRDRGVVLASERWHPGVIGIVASRVVERIHRPTVMVAIAGGEGKGSARSVPGFHLQRAFVECGGHLVRYGGHRAAAGCSIRPDRIEAFRAAFDAVARREIEDDGLDPTIRLDGQLRLPEANRELLRYLRHFGPFGIGNPTPVFAAYGVGLAEPPRVVGSDHLKLTVREGGTDLDAIGFGMAERAGELASDDATVDIAFRLEENSGRPGWRGEPRLQARLVDIRRSA